MARLNFQQFYVCACVCLFVCLWAAKGFLLIFLLGDAPADICEDHNIVGVWMQHANTHTVHTVSDR